MDPKLLQQIEQYLKDSGLNAQELKNKMDAVKASTVEFNRELTNAQRHFNEINKDVNDLSSQFKNVLDDLRNWDSTSNRINKSFKTLGGIADKLKYDSQDISRLSKKDLEGLEKKTRIELDNLKARKAELDQKYESNTLTDKELSQYIELNGILEDNNRLANDQNNYVKTLLALLAKRKQEEEDINKTLGISGKIVDGIVGSLNKLGISSTFFENLKEDMRDAAKSGDKWKVVTAATQGLFKGIGEALQDPVTKLTLLYNISKFFFKAALTANAQTVQLGKALGTSAERFREELVGIESTSSNLNVNTANLVEAFDQLAQATGFAYEFSADQLETQIKLTKQVGLQADEAAQIQRFAVLNGKTSEETYRSFLRGLTAARNQLKVGINFKATLAEAAKISGQLAANLGFNPERIAKAVVTAKAFGMTLEQVAKAGESLLNFETSIENELKAELLTGKQLNLERARAAALAGDQVTLAEELAKNVGTARDFTKMNVLQQRALAESVGMTADELANTLRKREEAIASGKSLAQVTAEEAAEAVERQNIQDKFNAAMLKLQSIIGNLVSGPLGMFVDSLSDGLEYITKIFGYFGKIFSTIKSIPGVGPLLGGIASIATIGALMTLVTKSLTKGTVFNPMIVKDVSGGGMGDIGESLTGKRGGVFGRLKQAYKGGGIKGAGKSLGRMIKPAGKFLGKASVGGLLGGLALDYGAEKAAQAGNKDLAKGLGVGSGALSGAGIGAMIGSAFPIIGTAIGAGVGGAIGGLGALLSDNDEAQQVEDGVASANSGPFKITDKFGNMAITKKGDGLAVSPNINSATSVDLTPMISAINEVRAAVNNLINRPVIVNMDSKQVGSILVQNSPKSA